MAEVSVNINGRKYGMECDDGQEGRVVDLGQYVDHKVKQIAAAGAAAGESHLLVLTSLMLADEVMELKKHVANGNAPEGGIATSVEDEALIVNAIDHLAGRIEAIAAKMAK
ncbi:MAG: cell division protein ZapA [Alphaproteobacteria bacterium]|nr:cell division protein ZapA [Alphaproteobacteria bacterium]MCD8570582.1 cell division protein ZapA [Alphaproteobacteria bacterium]